MYNIGQALTANKDIEVEMCFGEKRIIEKGTKIYIGADLLHISWMEQFSR